MTAWLSACDNASDLPPRLRSERAQERGRALYLEQCAFCHGVAADGKGLRRQALSAQPQDFTNPAWRRRVTPEEIFDVIHNGRPGTSMPAWGFLRDEQIWDLTAYLLSVSPKADEEEP
ncbi:MAG: cytochrome c [Acidobacteriota bacterium]|nr:cytochrome c [Acidobacteriota bacterium]